MIAVAQWSTTRAAVSIRAPRPPLPLPPFRLQEQDDAAQQAARSAYDTAEQELAAVLSALVGGTARGPT